MPARQIKRGSGVSAEDLLALARDPDRFQGQMDQLGLREKEAHDALAETEKAQAELTREKAEHAAAVEVVKEALDREAKEWREVLDGREAGLKETDQRLKAKGESLEERERIVGAREAAADDREAQLAGRETALSAARLEFGEG